MSKSELRILGWVEGLAFVLIAVLAMAVAVGIVLILPIAAIWAGGALIQIGSLAWLWWTGRLFLWSMRGVVAWYATVRKRELVTTTVVQIDLTRYDAIEQKLTPIDKSQRIDWAKSYFCFQTSVDMAMVAGGESTRPSLIVGLPVFALCMPAELEALATRAYALRVEPISPMHLWLERINRGSGDRLAWLTQRQSESALNVALALIEWVTRRGRARLAQFADEYARSRVGESFDLALAKMDIIQANWELFIRQQLQPVLSLGGLPPIAAGFQQYVERTHPDAASTEESCYRLVDGMWANERRLCAAILPTDLIERLRIVAWDEAVNTLAPEYWLQQTLPGRAELEGKRVSDIPALVVNWNRLSLAFLGDDARGLMPDVRLDRIAWLLGAVFARSLTAAGWRAGSADLKDTCCRLDGRTVDPFTLVGELAKRKVSATEFAERCSEGEISDLLLWPESTPA